MRSDARDSIGLWVSAVGLFGLLLVGVHYGWFAGISETWIGTIVSVLGVVNLVLLVRGIWQRRASNPNNPNVS